MIGTFSIPVGKLKTKTEKKRADALQTINEILQFLQGQIMKDGDALQREASESRSKSGLSDAAQKRMSKKLKNQANKMRGAVDKLNAARRIGDAIEDAKQQDIVEEQKSPKPGYNELVDENSNGADEENQIAASHIDGYDETLFKDLSENDPLLVERKNLLQAKKELDSYLEKRAS